MPRPALRRASAHAALLSCTALAFPATGQELSEAVVLDEVVITAAGFEQAVADAPASVTVIDSEELARRNVTSLSDALRGVQGVVTTGIAAEQDISIRGLPGQYTLILVDGKRQGTRESRPNGSSGYEQSFIPPAAAIERIEIVRGPMSSLYGSDAMGGVVNIITKKVADRWGGSVTAETTLPQHDRDGSATQGSFYLSGPVAADQLGLQVWGRVLERDESEVLDGLQGAEEFDLTGRLTWAPTDNQEMMLDYGTSRLQRFLTPGRTVAADGERDRQDNDRDHWSLTHVGRWQDATTELSFSRETGQRTGWSLDDDDVLVRDLRAPEIENSILDAKVTAPLTLGGQSHMLVGGLVWQRAELRDQNPGLGTDEVMTFSADQWAVYAEDQWELRDDLSLTLGARWTDHEYFGGELTPRAYAVWKPRDGLTIKGGVSTGYRTPDLRQIVPGYYYTTQRGAGVIVSNPDLKPENSTSYELGAVWERDGTQFSATAFQTDFENKIESYNTGETIVVGGNTFNRWEQINVQDARLRGIELTADTELRPDLTLRASYTYTDSEQLSGIYEGLPLTRTPKHMASLQLDWDTPVQGLSAWGAVNHHGEEVNAGARIGTNGTPYAYDEDGDPIAFLYDAYTTVDVGANYQFNDQLTLNGAVYNLLDEDVTAAENNTYQEGRRLWLGMTSTF
ncbi:TonB-dependent receptor domain-containing protein [Paracoccus luteus]|uniref:TonB-dependent receptor domain-containing protein n=1 Tax=Paracoccus luteus TaxID=2508543 RepID=UPI00106F1603|nr:TonB-dependent receptor [Paracoccus luteus]